MSRLLERKKWLAPRERSSSSLKIGLRAILPGGKTATVLIRARQAATSELTVRAYRTVECLERPVLLTDCWLSPIRVLANCTVIAMTLVTRTRLIATRGVSTAAPLGGSVKWPPLLRAKSLPGAYANDISYRQFLHQQNVFLALVFAATQFVTISKVHFFKSRTINPLLEALVGPSPTDSHRVPSDSPTRKACSCKSGRRSHSALR